MKKLSFLFLGFAMLASSFFTSCEKDVMDFDSPISPEQESIDKSECSVKSTRKQNAIWDRFKAAEYALRWSNNSGLSTDASCYNTSEYIYWVHTPDDQLNSDCANFISQCLGTEYPRGGGLPTDNVWNHNGLYYPKLAWMQAKTLMNYLNNKYNIWNYTISNKQSEWNYYQQHAAIGDIIFMCKEPNSDPYHVGIVTKIEKHWDRKRRKYVIDAVKFTAHTNNRRNADLYYFWNNASKEETYYIVRL